MLLSEQWVLVTGGGRRLGAAIARASVREDAGAVVNYRKSETSVLALKETQSEKCRCTTISAAQTNT